SEGVLLSCRTSYSIFDKGNRDRGIGYWVLGIGYWVLGIGYWVKLQTRRHKKEICQSFAIFLAHSETRITMKTKALFSLIVLFVLVSAFKERPKNLIKLKKVFTSSYAYIPNGSVTIDEREIETSAFYMFRTEVSNLNYAEFLNFLTEDKLKSKYAVKSNNWTELFASEPLAEHYYAHPAYENYPVVNVSAENAGAYCDWLTSVYETIDIGLPDDMKLVFRLPTRAEWVRAANGEAISSYSWGSGYLRNTDGVYLANFNGIGSEHIHRNAETGEFEIVTLPSYMGVAGHLNDHADVTAPVDGYAAHGFGLKQMNGNVAEMLADSDQAAGGSWRSPGYDIRNESLMPYDDASPEVGFRPIAVLVKK
ncbi:MAG: sulfatase activating formylglycine-generating enzyme, partial [Cryomorphaceae bacterium]